MGASVSVVKNDDSSFSKNKSLTDFPKCGVKLSFQTIFVELCGGEGSLKGLTTTEVCEQYVKPMTDKFKCSFCEMLEFQSHEAVGVATVFISHAWKYQFLDVLEALKFHFREQPDIVIWFDLFSNNQHKAVDLDFNWWCNTFKSAIRDFNHVVMVLAPWNDPIPLTRAWCLFELYCSAELKVKFEVAMSRKEQSNFLTDIIDNTSNKINNMVEKIDCKNSESFNPLDKAKIFDVVTKTVGFNRINSMVFEQLREWVVEITTIAVETTTSNNTSENVSKLASLQMALGELLRGQGKYILAEMQLLSCYKYRLTLLGAKHPDTLTAMNHLACIYSDLAQHSIAEPYFEQCYALRVEVLGALHADTLLSLDHLAVLYASQGKVAQAESLFQECLEKRVATLGEDHGWSIQSLNNLANIYRKLGKYSLAEPLFEKSYEKRLRLLGATHPDTLMVANNLATFYCSQGKTSEAEVVYLQCLEGYSVKFGQDHPDTLKILNNLANVYQTQGKYAESEGMNQTCLTTRKQLLGMHHVDTIMSVNNLAAVFQLQGKVQQAEELYLSFLGDSSENERVEAGSKQLDGEYLDVWLLAMTNLAVLYKSQGKLEPSEALYTKIHAKRLEFYGSDHPDTLKCQCNMAILYSSQAKYDQAIECYISCIDKMSKLLGSDHLDVLAIQNNLALVYMETKQYAAAEKLYLHCKSVYKDSISEEHPRALDLLQNLALLYTHMEKYNESEQLYLEHYTRMQNKFGNHHSATLLSAHNLGALYYKLQKYTQAEEVFLHIVASRMRSLGVPHKDTLSAMQSLAAVYQNMGRHEDCQRLLDELATHK